MLFFYVILTFLMLKLHIYLFIHKKLKLNVTKSITKHWYFSKLTFAVSSVFLAQFINTLLSSAIIGFHCYEYH